MPFIAVQSCSFLAVPNGQVTASGTPTTQVSIEGQKAWAGMIPCIINGVSVPPFAQVAPFAFQLPAMLIKKAMAGGQPFVAQGDQVTVTVPVQHTSTGAPGNIPVTVTVQMAGQTKVQAL